MPNLMSLPLDSNRPAVPRPVMGHGGSVIRVAVRASGPLPGAECGPAAADTGAYRTNDLLPV